MEVQLLKDMIQDRDERIELIKRKTEDQKEKVARLRVELDEVHDKNANQQITYQTEKTQLLHRKQQATEKLSSMQRDLQQQGASLRVYAGVVQQETQAMGDSSYVMRMQAQLCKAMHSMGIIDHQLDLARKHADSISKTQKEALASLTEEKSHVELELMNDLMKSDTERREVEEKLTSQLDDVRKDIEAMEKQIEENEDSEEDEEEGDEEEEEDEEEKEIKEELMKLLQEKRDEIERLESETEQQSETIEQLESGEYSDAGVIAASSSDETGASGDDDEDDDVDDEEEEEFLDASEEEEEEELPGSERSGSEPQTIEETDKFRSSQDESEGEDDLVEESLDDQ